jgi:phosphate transport system substrate-binding protein
MNDEFLHRIRKAPPPQFLDGLKARLDRQPPLVAAPRRRWTFTRGLLAGLLLGGAAFAFLARLVQSPQHSPPQVHETQVVPLGPVWLPEHLVSHSEPPKVPAPPQSAAPAQKAGPTNPAAAKSGSSADLPIFEQVRVVAVSTAYPVAWSIASRIGRFTTFGRVKVDINTSNPFDRLCVGDSTAADLVALPRRITRGEFQRCSRSGAYGLVEVKTGYQAITLARSQLYGPLKLTARDLYLALARRVPDPNQTEKLIDNPYTTWNQVDPTLPYDRIQIVGPALNTPAGKLASALLLEAGCNSLPWVAKVRDVEPERYEQICGRLREDGTYQEVAAGAGFGYLATNPTALGVFSPNDYGLGHNDLVLIPVDGITATMESVSAGTYPLARPLYLYMSALRSLGNQVIMSFIRVNMASKDLYASDPNGWGFVQLNKSEIDANLAIAQERRELRF